MSSRSHSKEQAESPGFAWLDFGEYDISSLRHPAHRCRYMVCVAPALLCSACEAQHRQPIFACAAGSVEEPYGDSSNDGPDPCGDLWGSEVR